MSGRPVERVVVLSDDDLQCLLRGGRADEAMKAKLRKALDQPQGEVRTEYRLVGERESDGATVRRDPHSELLNRSVASGYLKQFSRESLEPGARYSNIRIQSRTVTETEWTDIDQQEGDE